MFIQDDNFLSPDEIKETKDLIFNKQFPWAYYNKTASSKYDIKFRFTNSNAIDNFQLVHTFYEDFAPKSEFYNQAAKIFGKFLIKHNIPLKAILRGKVNLTTKYSEPDIPFPQHVDYPYEHKVFIYYPIDSDGDTVIYNEDYSKDLIALTESQRITPVAGRGIVFDGIKIHTSCHPYKFDHRTVINIPFL